MKNIENYGMKRIIFVPKTRSKYFFVKKSFRKDFRIIFIGEKIGFKKKLFKKAGARQWCDWAGIMGKMGRGAGSAREEEAR
jgi:hypothetical protein